MGSFAPFPRGLSCPPRSRRRGAAVGKSRITRAVREANAAVEESNATGAPLDEVLDMRRERRATHVAASQEVVEAYNDAATRLRDRGVPEDRVAVALSMDDIQRLRVGAPVDRRGFSKGAGVAATALAAAGLTGSSVLRPARAEAATAPRHLSSAAGSRA